MNPFSQEMVKMQFPKGMGEQMSVGGFMLDADKDGCVQVPKHMVTDLQAHGLSVYAEPAKKG